MRRRAGRQGERGLQTFKSGDTSALAALAQDGRASLESWTSATPAPGHRAPLGNGGPLPGVGGLRVSLALSLAQGPTGGIRTDSFLQKLTGQRRVNCLRRNPALRTGRPPRRVVSKPHGTPQLCTGLSAPLLKGTNTHQETRRGERAGD